MSKKILLLFIFPFILYALYANNRADFYNVKDYGAKGDGKALDSKAINKAIDAAAKNGGGTVYIPAGNYLSGAIHLKRLYYFMILIMVQPFLQACLRKCCEYV